MRSLVRGYYPMDFESTSKAALCSTHLRKSKLWTARVLSRPELDLEQPLEMLCIVREPGFLAIVTNFRS